MWPQPYVATTKRRDKMCLWSTAGTPKFFIRLSPIPYLPLHSFVFALFLLPFCYPFAIDLLPSGLYGLLVAILLLSDCYLSLFYVNAQGTLAMYTSPRRKGSPSESRSSLRADNTTLNPPPLCDCCRAWRLGQRLTNAKEFRARSPLSGTDLQPLSGRSPGFFRENPGQALACIAMQLRKTCQGRFSRVRAGKAVSFGAEAAETR